MGLKNTLPSFEAVTIDDIRLGTNLTLKTKSAVLTLSDKSLVSHTFLLFAQFGNNSGTFVIEKQININGPIKNHLNCDCFAGRNPNGKRLSILFKFGSDKPSAD